MRAIITLLAGVALGCAVSACGASAEVEEREPIVAEGAQPDVGDEEPLPVGMGAGGDEPVVSPVDE